MTAEQPPPDASIRLNISDDMVNSTTISKNLQQEIHVTTRDKVELALRRVMPRYSSTGKLFAIAGVFLTLMTALVTSDFKTTLKVSGEQWQAGFAIATIASSVWLLAEFAKWRRRPSLEDVVNEVLKSADSTVAEVPLS